MNYRQLFVLGCIVSSVTVLSRCISRQPAGKDLRGKQYAAASTCMSCHSSIYASYANTAHNRTSALATAETVKGTFTAPGNVFHFGNNTDVVMEQSADGLFQAAYKNGSLQQKQAFDIAIGSGRKAQTYLYWLNDKYFQLPVSWFVPAASWANSPGFPASHPMFDRLIPNTCFGCHSSMSGLKSVKAQGLEMVEEFEKKRIIAGIDCQRCHGPAANHVNFHTEYPEEKQAHYITKIDTLNNDQKLDMCAICHSGLKPMQRSAFEFKPGDALNDFLLPTAPYREKPDVHGNQFQLLASSQCFKVSRQMNCSSCHNPHTTERDNMQVFSQRCMTCHQPESDHFCKLTTTPAATLQQNCINCHMPAQPSNSITLLANGQKNPTPDLIRTHLIAVYK